jgi:hypothetical protein
VSNSVERPGNPSNATGTKTAERKARLPPARRSLADGLVGRLPRREVFFLHDPFDVLDHHVKKIVHHDADGEHEAEERQRVDSESRYRRPRNVPMMLTGTAPSE